MPQVIVVPNGDELEFPDNTDDSVISEVIKREYGGKSVTQPAPIAPSGDGFSSSAGQPESVIRAVPVGGLVDSSAQLPYPNQDVTDFIGSGQQVGQPESSFASSALASTAKGTLSGLAGVVRIAASASPDTPMAPLKTGLKSAADALSAGAEEAYNYYEANPASTNPAAQVGRAAGSFAAASPALVTGPAGLAVGAAQMASSTFNEAYNKAVSEGLSEGEAQQRAYKEAAKTAPQLLAFTVGGKLASAATSKLLGAAAGPLEKAIFGTAAATGANAAVGSATRAIEAEPGKKLSAAMPSFESMTMDALFGIVHGVGEGSKASQEVRQRASEELKARGVPEEAATPTALPGTEEKTTSVDLSKFGFTGKTVDTEAGVVITPEGKRIDLATGAEVYPVREQSLKSLGKLPEITNPVFKKDLLSSESPRQLTPEEQAKFEQERATPPIQYVLPPRAEAAGDVMVPVKVEAVEQTFSKDPSYVAPGAEDVEGRRAGVEDFLKTGKPVQTPEVDVSDKGKVSFTDGRHRYAVLRDNGEKVVQVAMSPEAADNARKAGIVAEETGPVAPGASNVRELQQKQVVAGADILKGLKQSSPEPVSRELWEKNFLRQYPEREGDREFLDRVYQQSTRAVEQSEVSPTKPMPEVVRQLDNPLPEGASVSTRNADVNANREERNLGPLEAEGKRDFGTLWDDASRISQDEPQEQFRVINELKENDRGATDAEVALITHRMVELRNQQDREYENLDAAYELGDRDLIQEALGRQRIISDELAELEVISNRAGTQTARGLNARKLMAKQDFSRARMEQRIRAEKNGDTLTPEESVKIKELSRKIAATDTAFEEYRAEMEEKVAKLEAQKAVTKIVERVKKEAAPKQNQVQRATEWLKSKADEARARIKARREQGKLFSGGINPEELDDYIVIGASKIAEGTANFAKWSKEMLVEFGEAIKPYLKDIFSKAGQTAKEAPKQLTQEEQRTRILDGIKTRVAEGDTATSLGPYIQRLAENAVRSGITEREPLVNAVHTVLKYIVPGITPREVQDAISGYGKFSQLSQDEVKVKLRDLKGQLQQVSKIEDMQAKVAPKKTGVERRTPSDEERRLIKEVNELKKKGGFTVTDPATQLKTALGAIKTRLRNQIADLDLAISKKERIPTKKGGVPYDTEANTLKVQRDALKQQYDSIFNKLELTDEQRIQQAKGAVEWSIKEYEDRIKSGDLARRQKKPGPINQELQVMRDERDALKAELEELRASDSWLQEQKTQEGLKKSIAGLEQKLSIGEPTKSVKAGPESKEVSDLKARREALQGQLKAVREASPETLNRRIEATVQSLDKSIAEYDRKLKEGDFSKRQTKPPLDTPEIERLRAERDAMRKLHQELVNTQKPKLSADEVALKAAKSRLKTMKAQYERKLAAGDFEPRQKKEFPKDAEFHKLKAENTIAKEEYMKALFDARMKARPVWKKIAGGVAETFNTSRSILTGFDFSAVRRQGGFILSAGPIRGSRALKPMFLAAGLTPKSGLAAMKAAGKQLLAGRPIRAAIDGVKTIGEYGELMSHAVMEEIRSRPNYPAAEHAKLFLSDEGALSLTKMEEAFMGRWSKHIPGVAGSARAYTTFLNRLRMDKFDSMSATLTKTGTPTPTEARAIANYINVATGRGSIHSSMAQAAAGLNTAFFAPRWVTSRFQLLLGQPFYGGSARTRKLIALEYAKMLAGAASVYGLGLAAGGTINTDPDSSDFLKLKFGNTRIDPMFGLLNATVFMSRFLTGKVTTTQGEVKDLTKEKKGPYDPDRGSLTSHYLRTKLAPLPGNITSLMTGKDLIGKPFGPKEFVVNSVVPITISDIASTMKEQGIPAGTIFSILSLFGDGLQTYKVEPPKGRSYSSSLDSTSERRNKSL